jgi:general secretion pathway protein G
MNTQHPSSCRGFSLVELLIVAAIIGLIVAIAVPNLVNAIHRGRQSRTVGDARSISTSVAMYQQDFAAYPVSASLADAELLRPHILPYMANYGSLDGWRRPFMYISDGDHYTLVSYALNGIADTPWVQGTTNYFDDDIVLNDGNWLQVPEGTQE